MKQSILCCLLIAAACTAKAQPSIDTAIVASFRQGAAGNCASVSVIKLAMTHYGIDHVFLRVDSLANSYAVYLRDGSQLDLTRVEYQTMLGLNKFLLLQNPKAYHAAQFMYAVMAKKKYLLGGHASITSAASYKKWFTTHYLLAQNTVDNIDYLGLKNSFKVVDKSEITRHTQIIITSPKHSAYSSLGYYDEFGEAIPNENFTGHHGGKELNQRMHYVLID
jgi:hypothetical protein